MKRSGSLELLDFLFLFLEVFLWYSGNEKNLSLYGQEIKNIFRGVFCFDRGFDRGDVLPVYGVTGLYRGGGGGLRSVYRAMLHIRL